MGLVFRSVFEEVIMVTKSKEGVGTLPDDGKVADSKD